MEVGSLILFTGDGQVTSPLIPRKQIWALGMRNSFLENVPSAPGFPQCSDLFIGTGTPGSYKSY